MGKNEVVYITEKNVAKEISGAAIPAEAIRIVYEIKMDSLDAPGIKMTMPASTPGKTTFENIVENARGRTEADIREYAQTFKKGYKETLSAYNRFKEALNKVEESDKNYYNLSCAGKKVKKDGYIDGYLFKKAASLEGHKELKPIVMSVTIGPGAE